ncbi:MAG: Cna B-type domain-containing protein [Oscillospiraceae bacterium]
MKDLGSKIRRLIKYDRKRRVYKGFSAALALAVAVCVISSLVMPAISLTGVLPLAAASSITDTITYDQFENEYSESDAYSFVPNVVNVSATQKKDENGNPIVDGDSISVSFELQYMLPQGTITTDKPYIHYNLNTSSAGQNVEFAIPNGGLPAANAIGDVTFGGDVVGKYRIEENGEIIIRFTDEAFIERNADGDINNCVVEFSADVSQRSDSGKNNEGIDFNNDGTADVILSGFQYGKVTMSKSAVDNHDGTISWTIDVNNPDGKDLSGLTLSDSMFAKSGGTVSGPGTYDEASGTFKFNSVTDTSVSVTYTTELTPGMVLNGGGLDNEAVLTDEDDKPVRNSKTSIYHQSSFEASKSASTHYADPSVSGDKTEIEWTVTIENKDGIDLKDYVISDAAFANAKDLVATDSNGNTLTLTETTYTDWSGDRPAYILPSTTGSVTITYKTNPSADSDYQNKATLATPDKNTGKDTNTVYVEKNQFSIGKNGELSQDGKSIKWTIWLSDKVSGDGVSIADFVITDDMFADSTISDLKAVDSNGNEVTLILDGTGKYKVPSDIADGTNLTITYVTSSTASDSTTEGGSAEAPVYTTKNTVGAEKPGYDGYTADKTVVYDPNGSVQISKGKSGTVSLDMNSKTITAGWEIKLESKTETGNYSTGSFVNNSFTDSMTAEKKFHSEVVLDHYITQAQADAAKITVYWYNESSGGYTSYDWNNIKDSYPNASITLVRTDGGKNFDIVFENCPEEIVSVTVNYKSTISFDDPEMASGDLIKYDNTLSCGNLSVSQSGGYYIPEDERFEKLDVETGSSEDTKFMPSKLEQATIDGQEVYLFRYQIVLNENGSYSSTDMLNSMKNGILWGYEPNWEGTPIAQYGDGMMITDTLPDGFKLNTTSATSNDKNGNLSYWFEKHDESGTLVKDGATNIGTKDKWAWLSYEYDSATGKVVFYVKSDAFNAEKRLVIQYQCYIPIAELESAIQSGTVNFENKLENSLGETTSQTQKYDPSAYDLPNEQGLFNKKARPQQVGGYIEYVVDFNPNAAKVGTNGWCELTDLLNFNDKSYKDSDGNIVSGDAGELLNVSLSSVSVKEVLDNGTTVDVAFNQNFTSKPTDITTNALTVKSVAVGDRPSGIYSADTDDVYSIQDYEPGQTITITLNTDNSYAYSFLSPGDWGFTWVVDRKTFDPVDGTVTIQATVPENANSAMPAYLMVINGLSTGESGVRNVTASSTTVTSAADAKLVLTVPDQKHLQIVYRYKANSDKVDTVTVDNTISMKTSSGIQGDYYTTVFDAHDDSSAHVEQPLEIEKVDVGNSAVKLNAGFALVRYSGGSWQIASKADEITQLGSEINAAAYSDGGDLAWTDISGISSVTDANQLFTTESGTYLRPEKNVLYALVELRAPEGYMVFGSGYTVKYFTYETNVSDVSMPYDKKGLKGENLTTVGLVSILSDGGKVSVKNVKKISVSIEKTWSDGNAKHADKVVEFGLYRSTVSPETSMGEIPADAELIDSIKLNDTASATEGIWDYKWDNLPAGNEYDQVYYYYVYEISSIDGYTPVIKGNGVNDTATIEILNTNGLSIKKMWESDQNVEIDAPDGTDSITVNLYRSETEPDPKALDTIPADAVDLGEYTLTRADGWTLTVTDKDKILKNDASHTYYYYAVETSTVSGFNAVYTENGVGSTGTVVITNVNEGETGVTLPETGGIGTAKLFIAGGMTAGTALALLVAKRRKKSAV